MRTVIRAAGIWISDGSILLESSIDRGVWGIPGGSLEDDETVEDACRREFLEEIGIEVRCTSLTIVSEHFWEGDYWKDDGKSVREYGFYFGVNPVSLPSVSRPTVRSREKHIKFDWFNLSGSGDMTILPAFLKNVLPTLGHTPVFVKSRSTDSMPV